MSIHIRRATDADADRITEFNALLASETEHLELDLTRLHQGVRTLLADDSKGIYFLVELDGHVVGQLMITYEWSDWRNGTFWWLQSVYVEKSARGKGVFTTLYRYVESLARSDKDVCGFRLYVEKNNAHAQRTYSSFGMKKSQYELYEIEFTRQV
jgi:GNAT superfamily N-acetyltransferase